MKSITVLLSLVARAERVARRFRANIFSICATGAETDERALIGRQCSARVGRRLGYILLFGLLDWPERRHNPSEPYAPVTGGLWHVDTTIPLLPGSVVELELRR